VGGKSTAGNINPGNGIMGSMTVRDLKAALDGVSFRSATSMDVADMAACRLTDPAAGPADQRMTAYFNGQHHPQRALTPRIGYVALADGTVIGYVAGHLTTRHDCEGEVQYLFVAPTYRRRGIATALLRLLAGWFQEHARAKVCVCVDAGSPAAQPFYDSLGASPLSPLKKYWYVWENIGILITNPRA
jgi:GNAT superfamily N-acetyltransferase